MMPLVDSALTDSGLAGGDSDVLIRVENVSKKFCRSLKRSLWYGVRDIAAEVIGQGSSDKLRVGEFWALKDISFELRRGEALGLVGANGAGKTTLLRIISGLIKPDAGSLMIRGRVAPLIALGAGFNPILTGRENIYVNMAILGLSKAEIDQRFDEVVEFAEIGEAIDAPVQSYSSGMAARLGFACAIHTEPDILLIDEVLSVGDAIFQSKCYRKLDNLRERKVSIIMVSHNPEAILSVCREALYVKSGSVKKKGEVNSVISIYEEDVLTQKESRSNNERKKSNIYHKEIKNDIFIENIFFRNKTLVKIDTPISGDKAYLCLNINSKYSIEKLCIRLSIQKQGEVEDTLFFNNLNEGVQIQIKEGLTEIQLLFPSLGLMPGLYVSRVGIHCGSLYQVDTIPSWKFKVLKREGQTNLVRCKYYQDRHWIVSKTENVSVMS